MWKRILSAGFRGRCGKCGFLPIFTCMVLIFDLDDTLIPSPPALFAVEKPRRWLGRLFAQEHLRHGATGLLQSLVRRGCDALPHCRWLLVAEENGASADYGHMDLLLGERAAQDVFVHVERWLREQAAAR